MLRAYAAAAFGFVSHLAGAVPSPAEFHLPLSRRASLAGRGERLDRAQTSAQAIAECYLRWGYIFSMKDVVV